MNYNIDKFKKIYALALQGVDGEKEQAAELLEKLMKKHNLSFADLDEGTTKEFDFEFHGRFEEKLLLQTVYKVTNDPKNFHNLKYTYSGRKCRTKARVTCTEVQKAEISFLFDFYKDLFKKRTRNLI